MLHNDPEAIFTPIVELLKHPVLSVDAEMAMWMARIASLKHVGETIENNGISVERLKRNAFRLNLCGRDYRTEFQDHLIDGQKRALNLILRGESIASTPTKLQSEKRGVAQMALF